MTVEQSVSQHYTRGALERTLLDALAASGKDIDHLDPDDLAPVDEFHIGGRQATVEFAQRFAPRRGMHLLDVGSGIGGPSRFFAHTYGCWVTGIDLTDEYVRVAEEIARRSGLSGSVSYRQGSATALPFAPGTFDGAYMLHVGMNIEDKAALFASVRRVLRPGAVFGVYDVMRDRPGELRFPVPWAPAPGLSFVDTPAKYRELFEGAGFTVTQQLGRREFAIDFFQQLRARSQAGSPPPLGLHLLMGTDAAQKIANMIANLESGLISPAEMMGQAAGVTRE